VGGAPSAGTPTSGSREIALNPPGSVAAVGSGVTINGSLPGRHDDVALLESSVNDSPWQTLATGVLDANGRFQVSFR
jgi:hypothetical protein